jgi:hypothetical protein
MTSRGSASSSLAGVLAAARSAPSPSPVPIPDRLEPLSPVSPALPSPASATASTTVGGTSVPGTDTASTAVPQRGPRRTSSSSSQSSLRARFLARAPPEASVTATLVSTSLSSGAHNIDHSYSHSLTDSMSPLPTHGRRRAAPGRGIVSSSGEVQSPALQTHANANAQASDMNDANAHTNTHGSMHAAGPVPVQLQPSGPGTKDGQIPTHKGPKLGGDKEGPGVGTGEIAVAGNTNLRSFETTVDATSVSLGISTATTTTSTAELTEVKETKAEAETETESDTAVQPDSTPAQALSPPSSSSRKQAGTDSLPSTPQAPASSRYSSSYRPRTMNALHAGVSRSEAMAAAAV